MKGTTGEIVLGIAVTAVAYFGLGTTQAQAQTNVCATWPTGKSAQNQYGTYDVTKNGTPYKIELDAWGLAQGETECINYYSSGNSVGNFTVANNTSTGNMLGFPNALNGSIFNFSTSDFNPNNLGNHFPIQEKSITSMPITWTVGGTSPVPPGTWNASIEFFANTSKPTGTVGNPNGIELMVTTNASAGYDPGGLGIMGQAAIGGTLWDVRATGNWSGGWNYFVYMPACGANCGDSQPYSPLLTQINTDFKPFFDDALTRSGGSPGATACIDSNPTSPANSSSCLDPNWWVTGVQAGFELLGAGSNGQNGTNLASTNFTVKVNGGSTPLYGQVAASTDSAGNLEVAYPEFNGVLSYTYQCLSCPGYWSPEAIMGGGQGVRAKQVVLGSNSDGTLSAYYNDPTNSYLISYFQQTAAGSGNWPTSGSPTSLGVHGKNLVVVQNPLSSSTILFYADASSNALKYKYQCSGSGCTNGWSSEQTLKKAGSSSAATANQIAVGYWDWASSLVVLYTDPSTNTVKYNTQGPWADPGAAWNGEQTLYVNGTSGTAVTAQQIALHISPVDQTVMYVGSNGALNYKSWSAGWGNQTAFPGNTSVRRFAVRPDPVTSAAFIVYVGTDNLIHQYSEQTPGQLSTLTALSASGSYPARDVMMVYRTDGLYAFFSGVDGSLQRLVQDGPGAWLTPGFTTIYVPGPYPNSRAYVNSSLPWVNSNGATD